jgi:hypothetical protein
MFVKIRGNPTVYDDLRKCSVLYVRRSTDFILKAKLK